MELIHPAPVGCPPFPLRSSGQGYRPAGQHLGNRHVNPMLSRSQQSRKPVTSAQTTLSQQNLRCRADGYTGGHGYGYGDWGLQFPVYCLPWIEDDLSVGYDTRDEPRMLGLAVTKVLDIGQNRIQMTSDSSIRVGFGVGVDGPGAGELLSWLAAASPPRGPHPHKTRSPSTAPASVLHRLNCGQPTQIADATARLTHSASLLMSCVACRSFHCWLARASTTMVVLRKRRSERGR